MPLIPIVLDFYYDHITKFFHCSIVLQYLKVDKMIFK